MAEAFDELLRQARDRKRDEEERAKQAGAKEAARLAEASANARARARAMLPEVHKAVEALRLAGPHPRHAARDGWNQSVSLGDGCVAKFDPNPFRLSARGQPSRWGRVARMPGWSFFVPVRAVNDSWSTSVWVFVPLSGEPCVGADYLFGGVVDVGKGLSLGEYADRGHYEWSERPPDYKLLSYVVDTDDVLARFLRSVAAYVADGQR